MADLLDDLIGISKEFGKMKDDLIGVSDDLTGEQRAAKLWNPVDYKEVPRVDASKCVRCIAEDEATCTRCFDICPTDSIIIEEGGIEIKDNCRKCGLCVGACPNDALKSFKYEPRRLYDDICKVADTHEMVYVTCTRALGHVPEEGEFVLPCIGMLTPEMWTALMIDRDNIAVYLPLGKCEKCKTTTGEEAYSRNIALGETWSGGTLGFECDEEDLVLGIRHDVERREFVQNAAKKAGLTAANTNPLTRKATQVYQRLQEHSKQLTQMTKTLERITGGSSTADRKRNLEVNRSLLLVALRDHEDRAHLIEIRLPQTNPELCVACGTCVKACPMGALDLIERPQDVAVDQQEAADTSEPTPQQQKISQVTAPYCTGCDLCRDVCPHGAIAMVDETAQVFFDIKTDDGNSIMSADIGDGKASKAEVAKAKSDLKDQASKAKGFLSKAMDTLERFDDDEDEDTPLPAKPAAKPKPAADATPKAD